MADFAQTLVTALAVGSLYALIALGYTMVYGILKFINFAHSDIVVLGAWLSYTLATKVFTGAAHSWWGGGVILLSAMALCGLAGFAIERLAYKPLRKAPRLNVLITAIGVSLLLQNIGQLDYVFGPTPKSMPQLLPDKSLTISLPSGAGSQEVQLRLVDGIIIGTS